MRLQTLTVRQFRNHPQLTLHVDPAVNLLVGSNGAGKTNLVEAIAMLATGLSPRGAECESLVQWGKDGFSVLGHFVCDGEITNSFTLEMKYHLGEQRTFRQDGQTVVRLKDLVGKVPLVSFVPEDLALVKGDPEQRRRAVNAVLVQVDPHYTEALRRYNETLKARNAALRQVVEGQLQEGDLLPWDKALVEAGLVVCAKRQEFIDEFSSRVAHVQDRISNGADQVQLIYKPSFPRPWDQEAARRWREKLTASRAQELALGMTMSGPQRDEILFLYGGRPAKAFASEGQLRTMAVAFKLAEIPFILERRNETPICLLDDVLSELDAERAKYLLHELSRTGQCFVTLTGFESWPEGEARPAAIFTMDKTGAVERQYDTAAALS